MQNAGEETMRALRRIGLIAASLVVLAGMAAAAEIRVLSVEEAESAVRALAPEFKKDTGQEVEVTGSLASALVQKLKTGDTFDVLIAPESAMDELDGEGLVNPESRVRLARTAASEEKTTYEGALVSDGAAPEAARAFIQYLASPEAREQWIAARLDPLGER
jgi:ABC-type molybdate transport system substrate-binding protein